MANYAIITDLNRCTGCLACTVACKAINGVDVGNFWIKTLRVGPHPIEGGSGTFPDVEMYFLPVQCQHCENPECVKVCPTEASHVAEDGTITTELISTADVSDAAVAATAATWVKEVDEMLGEQIAVTDINFYISDPATGKRRIRLGETNLGDFVADGIYTYFNEIEQLDCDIAMMNGGGIRTDVSAGAWSFKTCKQISPFGNVACLMAVTGQQIQDALEFGARFVGPEGKENGGFLHVAGATYEIHTDVPNTVLTDDKNVWQGSATGTPRVQNVRIYDRKTGTYEPLDPNRTYALAGMNYTLRNLGDGFAMFDGAELIKDYVAEDYLVMSTYAMIFDGATEGMPVLASANSPLADYPGYLLNYEDPYGAGRIQMIW